jgi:hypothetical protein
MDVLHDAQVEAEENDDGGERHRGVQLQNGLQRQEQQLRLGEFQEEEFTWRKAARQPLCKRPGGASSRASWR